MVETFTPAVCGSRRRKRIAVAAFALGALAASALVGAALGAVGALVGIPLALAAAAVALLAALRETGLVRVPLPHARRQVPERWRAELPLPVWSFGYGAGLGAGFLTFQPVSTFWVACAAALALARPLPAAVCFAAFGLGRTLMAALPQRRRTDATAAVEALVARRQDVLRLNVAALIACAALLAATAAGASVATVGSGLDPSAGATALAFARMGSGSSSVLVEPRDGSGTVTFADASSPSIDGDLLAYQDSAGIKVVNWRTGAAVAQVDGDVTKPALDWPLLAYIRTGSNYRNLMLADFTTSTTPATRIVARVLLKNDLGRPSLAGGRIAWHRVTKDGSGVYVQTVSGNRRWTVARSKVGAMVNPSVSATRIVWVSQFSRVTSLWVKTFGTSTRRRIYRTTKKTRLLWTTGLHGRSAYVTQWSSSTRASTLVRVNF